MLDWGALRGGGEEAYRVSSGRDIVAVLVLVLLLQMNSYSFHVFFVVTRRFFCVPV